MSQPFDWGALVNAFLTAVGNILTEVAEWLSANASMIASVILGVGLFAFIYRRVLTRFLPGLREFIGGILA